jgi:hypothetical protein
MSELVIPGNIFVIVLHLLSNQCVFFIFLFWYFIHVRVANATRRASHSCL